MKNNFQVYESRLRKVVEKQFKKRNYEICLAAMNALCRYYYKANPILVDPFIEKYLMMIGENSVDFDEYSPNADTILFYDGVGFDLRGLALIYLKGLIQTGNEVIYVAPKKACETQPHITELLKRAGVVIERIETEKGYLRQADELTAAVKKYKPGIAFIYTLAFDVAGTMVFTELQGKARRLMINMGDHAFWVGIYSFDILIEYRNYGASRSHFERKIPKDKLRMLPFYPYIDKTTEFQGFPFDAQDKKVIFSGGSLYKTFGDKDRTYYRMVEHLLRNHPDTVFLYAGDGDGSELKRLMEEFESRVFHIKERDDLYQILRHSCLYLSTYPLLGGLMLQYSVIAGRIPLTLHYSSVGDGFLIKQNSVGIMYETPSELLFDADRLLTDDNYRIQREKLLSGCVISESEFARGLSSILSGGYTWYDMEITRNYNRCRLEEVFNKLSETKFQMKNYWLCIANRRNWRLFPYFTDVFLLRLKHERDRK